MAFSIDYREDTRFDVAWHEVTGAVGDSATVLPVVVAVAMLTDLSLPVMLLWFGAMQVVWGLYYGMPVSVEPMKALAALVVAGAVSTGELVVAGLLLGVVLLGLGWTRTLETVERYVGTVVVRGVQFGVALVLFETGLGLAGGDLRLAALAVGVAVALTVGGYRSVSALAVFAVGGVVALLSSGMPTPALPLPDAMLTLPAADLTVRSVEATLAQLAMTVGNAALATSVLLGDYFDGDVSADQLSTSMGAMNLLAVPLGGFPMCHGSGGVAGKYAFGARTPGANVVLGVGYALVAVLTVGLVAAYPTSVLGVILALVAVQLGRTGLGEADSTLPVVAIGVLGVLTNLGVAFVVGIVGYHALGER
ncbi:MULTISPECIES: putative sulfate/molybdate transporter [Haloarcula]|uniref:Sulfate transporter n=1 Tax=Haloarcula pellucida TaxID=1427151 RepID=A0A830GPD3_9EURY|nr:MULTISPECIES: putative sulfate/molybdate transporter [Halomicroarcula]MBX0350137.1 putative sulfate/molybdate transporter [Halomicroarcula pellucida]MDS0277762.1 putative sulfate/molybdate transporter [Halomicroarcula sp. S1AR25-4]GGO00576.1 sulfate transporter [Halomicroarcula pellucida]